jgi:hypothetical protein
MPAPKLTPHPESAPGDFYVEKGMCLSCGVPHVVAPDLMGWTGNETGHCIWRKQPETPKELDQAIAVLETQELGCHRYAGDNPEILKRISAEHCDYPAEPRGPSQAEARFGGREIHFALMDERSGFFTRVRKLFTGK